MARHSGLSDLPQRIRPSTVSVYHYRKDVSSLVILFKLLSPLVDALTEPLFTLNLHCRELVLA